LRRFERTKVRNVENEFTPTTKKEVVEEIILSADEAMSLDRVLEEFKKETNKPVSKEYVRKTAHELEEEGKITLQKEIAEEKYVVLKIVPTKE